MELLLMATNIELTSHVYSHSRCKYMTSGDADQFVQSSGLQVFSTMVQSSLPIAYLYAISVSMLPTQTLFSLPSAVYLLFDIYINKTTYIHIP